MPGGAFSFQLSGVPLTAYVVQASTNLVTWQNLANPTLPAGGSMRITDSQAASFTRRYYRALK
jgi:hypothetical protein